MAQLGYLLASNQGFQTFEHCPQRCSFYTNNTWFLIAQDDDATPPYEDWHLWKWDGTTPETPATPGGWSKAVLVTSGNPVNIDIRQTAQPDCAWDEANQTLHVVAFHSTEYYYRYTYDAENDEWTEVVREENVSATLNPAEVGSIAVDSNGILWLAYYTGAAILNVRYRDASAWNAATVIESVATLSTPTADLVAFNNGGTASIGVAYTYTETDPSNDASWRFAYRADSAAVDADWTKETIDDWSIDNHITIATAALAAGGDTLFVVGKDADDDFQIWTRSAAGAWSDPIELTGGVGLPVGTRPKLMVDESYKVVYLAYGSGGGVGSITSIRYQYSDATALNFTDSETVILTDDPASSGDFTDPTLPATRCNATTGILVASSGPGVVNVAAQGAWWNFITEPGQPEPSVNTTGLLTTIVRRRRR